MPFTLPHTSVQEFTAACEELEQRLRTLSSSDSALPAHLRSMEGAREMLLKMLDSLFYTGTSRRINFLHSLRSRRGAPRGARFPAGPGGGAGGFLHRSAAAPRRRAPLGGPSAASAASETSHVHGLVRTLRPLIGVLARFSPQLLDNVKAVYHRRMAGTLRALCAALAHEAKSSAPRRAVWPALGQPSLAAKSDSARALARYVATVCVEQLCNFCTSSTADLANKGSAFL